MNAGPHAAGSVVGDEAVRRPGARFTLIGLAFFLVLVLAGLGTWQLFRLQWKLDLIARVDQRVHAAALPAPKPAQWAEISAAADEYRHVSLNGTFRYDLTTRVQAVTELGSGYWLMSPLVGDDGSVTLVNRGFIPADAGKGDFPGAAGRVSLTGLLRMSEPHGGFLRSNDAAADRWYSRDVAAIAAAHGLPLVAPYFVDADASAVTQSAAGQAGDPAFHGRPVAGLTVVSFHNNHLVYAVTWFALALMLAAACRRLL
jgi:surfeit locus 1 family protein